MDTKEAVEFLKTEYVPCYQNSKTYGGIDNFDKPKSFKKKITIEKDLLFDIVKQIDKCFKDYVRQHEDADLPCNLDILSNAIVERIEKIFKNEEEDEEDIPDDEKYFYRKGARRLT